MNLINEGGPFFMVTLFILLGITIFLIIKGFKQNSKKNLDLIKAITLFALVFGLFGFILGLINALDMIDSIDDNTNPAILAGGLKRGILSPALGSLVFLIGRLGVVLLIWSKKQTNS